MKARDLSIDVLRCCGALVVMAAHVNAPEWLFQLRNFGTPLLIIVSALSAAVVFRHRAMQPWSFLKRRVLKLTLPPWTFLALFFGIALAYSASRGKPFPFTRDEVLSSFALRSGIGYVWIFRVYLIIALLTPCMLWVKARLGDRVQCFRALVITYLAYEATAAVVHAQLQDAELVALLDETLFTVVPYALLFAYGLLLGESEAPALAGASLASLALFALLAALKFHVAGRFVPTQAFKYPPTLYYLSYAFFWIHALVLAARSSVTRLLPARAVVWFSSNLLWIYLWHILGVFVWDLLVGPPAGRLGPAMAKLAFVVSVGVAITWLQARLLDAFAPHVAQRTVLRTIFG